MSALPHEVAEAFAYAAITALQEMAQVEAAWEDAGGHAAPAMHGELILATIPLVRELPGSMTLVLSVDAAASLASRYLPAGSEITPENIDDVAGEFANVIAGQAKTMLKGTPYHYHLATPNVARMNADQPGATPRSDLSVRLVTELSDIVLQINISGQTS